jgi:hypothetical protein
MYSSPVHQKALCQPQPQINMSITRRANYAMKARRAFITKAKE